MESKGPGYFAHAQDDLNLHIYRMFEGTFSLDAARTIYRKVGNVLNNQRVLTWST